MYMTTSNIKTPINKKIITTYFVFWRLTLRITNEKLYKKNLIAGVDEVGRGCLAGPVVSAAVIFKKNISLKKIKDSKKIKDIILIGSDDEQIKFTYDDVYEKYYTKQ